MRSPRDALDGMRRISHANAAPRRPNGRSIRTLWLQAGSTIELAETLEPLFDAIVKEIPPPSVYPDAPLQLLVTNIDYDEHKGRVCIARINAGAAPLRGFSVFVVLLFDQVTSRLLAHWRGLVFAARGDRACVVHERFWSGLICQPFVGMASAAAQPARTPEPALTQSPLRGGQLISYHACRYNAARDVGHRVP